MNRHLIVLASLLLGGCSQSADKPASDRGVKDAPFSEGGSKDITFTETTQGDLPRLDRCRPGCHWDCFGGVSCKGGQVYEIAYAPRPCCTSTDPFPDGCSCASPLSIGPQKQVLALFF